MVRRPRTPDGEDETGPLRRCLVSGEVKSKDELVRFVIDPTGTVVPDVEGRLPGRGFWLSARRDVVEKACAKNLFAKAARSRVTVPADLIDQVERRLRRRCLNLIGLARRAGQAVFGYEKARERLAAGQNGVLIGAIDGSLREHARLRDVALDRAVVRLFSRDELGAVAGRDRVAHGVIAPGRLAERLCQEVERLKGFQVADRVEDRADVDQGNEPVVGGLR